MLIENKNWKCFKNDWLEAMFCFIEISVIENSSNYYGNIRERESKLIFDLFSCLHFTLWNLISDSMTAWLKLKLMESQLARFMSLEVIKQTRIFVEEKFIKGIWRFYYAVDIAGLLWKFKMNKKSFTHRKSSSFLRKKTKLLIDCCWKKAHLTTTKEKLFS